MNLQMLRCTLLTCLITITVCSAASAQATIGLKLSSGLALVYDLYEEPQLTSAFITVGIGGTLNISLTDALALQPEVTYLTTPGDPFKFNEFAIPVLLIYKLAPKIKLEAGPSLHREFYHKSIYYPKSTPYLNIGANAGASFWFNEKLSVNMRYTYEIFRTEWVRDFVSYDSTDPLLSPGPGPTFRDIYITASLQYSFK